VIQKHGRRIDHHGTSCRCCGFDFEKVYGEHGKGFIHVHHIKPLHTVGDNYVVNPIEDMVPFVQTVMQ
jgi:5-methylcytosine-specific restriction protein A